jgi:predicted MFS family arabinose efflux permease
VGAGLGVGRIGAIVGPYIGGVLLARQWGPQELFWAAAAPAFISLIVIILLRIVLKGPGPAAADVRAAATIAH